MKQRLMTPGPTPVPEETLLELARPVFFHRTPEFRAILAEVVEDLKYVFQTKQPVIVLTSSGTAGMEAAVINTLSPGDKAILLLCGRWGERWRNICKVHGIEFIAVEVPYGQSNKPEQLEAALRQHPDAKAVFTTFCETSTGARNDIKAFGQIVAKTPALFVVDTISGLATMECRTDDWQIDINVTGSQKALMLPPGLAYVSVSPKAWSVIDKNKGVRSFYLDLKKYKAKLEEGSDTPYTPAHTLIRAQRTSLKKMRAEGIENIWARHGRMASAARAAAGAMGLKLFADQPADGLTVITVPSGVDGTAILSAMEKKHGFKLANGQDDLKGKIWRLAHMGYIDQFDVLGAISALKLELLAAGYKMESGAGVSAAQRALANEAGRWEHLEMGATVTGGLCDGVNEATVFSRVIGLGYYDGLTDGLVELSATGSVYRFKLIDEQQIVDMPVDRAYAFFSLPMEWFERLVEHLVPHMTPRWPVWVPLWRFRTQEANDAADTFVAQLTELPAPLAWIVIGAIGDGPVRAVPINLARAS